MNKLSMMESTKFKDVNVMMNLDSEDVKLVMLMML